MAQGKENGRILETIQEEHPAGTSQEWNLVVAPRRRAASDRPPGGSAPDSSPGDRAPVDRAPGDEVQSVTAQTADYRQEFPEDRQKRETKGQFYFQECSFQTNKERYLHKHIQDIHRITCFTCRDTFESFGKMIDHRRIKHPSNRKCKWFPECERGETCLYKHETAVESVENGPVQAIPAQHGDQITCRICNTRFEDKNEMMMHRKSDHIEKVNMCKNITAGITCRKGPLYCWYNHNQQASNTGAISRSTNINTTTVPAFNETNFPYGPTPKGVVVGQGNMDLQMIQQALLTQQQQMTSILAEILNLKK